MRETSRKSIGHSILGRAGACASVKAVGLLRTLKSCGLIGKFSSTWKHIISTNRALKELWRPEDHSLRGAVEEATAEQSFSHFSNVHYIKCTIYINEWIFTCKKNDALFCHGNCHSNVLHVAHPNICTAREWLGFACWNTASCCGLVGKVLSKRIDRSFDYMGSSMLKIKLFFLFLLKICMTEIITAAISAIIYIYLNLC